MGRWRRWRERRAERKARRDAGGAGNDRSPIDGDDYDAAAWRAASGLDRPGEWGGLPPVASRGLLDRLVSGPRRRR